MARPDVGGLSILDRPLAAVEGADIILSVNGATVAVEAARQLAPPGASSGEMEAAEEMLRELETPARIAAAPHAWLEELREQKER